MQWFNRHGSTIEGVFLTILFIIVSLTMIYAAMNTGENDEGKHDSDNSSQRWEQTSPK